ncbi:CBS domain-containing protein [Solirubrobacter soli]|uniref:CBS domain-containing protein n=1 Tax=Solirubrobacter soli TaxID=363832 RepID=UPI000421054D|nr:CBS domain-containing protein [Solirubrobacter soli]
MSSTIHIPLDEAGPSVSDVMMVGAESVGPDMPLADARAFFTPRKKLLLVTDGDRFLGTLTPADLPDTDDGAIGPHVNADPPRVTPDDPVATAMALVEDEDMTRIPVVDAEHRLQGMVCFNRSHEAFCIYPS